MKYLYLIPILFLFACPAPKEELFNVNFELSEEITISNARRSASVSDFDIPLGVVNLTASNTVSNKFYQETNTGDIVRSIELPLGNYDFSMSSEGEIPFNEFLKFDALLNSDVPVAGILTLPVSTDQALVIIKKTLDAIPTIEVNGVGASSYPVISLFDSPNYYYVFVYGSWGYEIKYTLTAQDGNIIRVFEAGKIYSYEFGSTIIEIEDPFTDVIVNQ